MVIKTKFTGFLKVSAHCHQLLQCPVVGEPCFMVSITVLSVSFPSHKYKRFPICSSFFLANTNCFQFLALQMIIFPVLKFLLSLTYILIPFHLCLGLPSGLLPSGFPTKILSTFLNYRTPATCPVHLNPCLSYEKDIRFEYKPFSGTFP